VVDGWHGDAAFTVGVGRIGDEAAALLATAEAALEAGIATLVPGARLGDYGATVAEVAAAGGAGVVRDYVGHGIGRAMHEPPDIPNHGRRGRGPRLAAGNTVAVEPMLVAGGPEVVELDDGWTVVTADGAWAAHVEHTVLVTEEGPEILTRC
jgi:methionyl aminopeptidase